MQFTIETHNLGAATGELGYRINCDLLVESRAIGRKHITCDVPRVPPGALTDRNLARIAKYGFDTCMRKYLSMLPPEETHSETDPATGPEPV